MSLKPEDLFDRVGEEEPQGGLGIRLERQKGIREENDEGRASKVYFKAGLHLGILDRLLFQGRSPNTISHHLQMGKLKPSREGKGVTL